ncbi:MAG: hypothetical protein V7722_08080 [Porticoccus sp.]
MKQHVIKIILLYSALVPVICTATVPVDRPNILLIAVDDMDYSDIAPFGPEQWQVFDLSVDPSEVNDISAQEPALKKRLIDAWSSFAESVGVVPLEASKDVNK